MQQLYLTGSHAAGVADQLFHALNVRPVGMRLSPVLAGDGVRGDAVELLLPPVPPMHNHAPCRVALSPERSFVVEPVLEEIAAPGLMAALQVHAPMLLQGLSADLLACGAFREAVRRCLVSSCPVVVVADTSAVPLLQGLTPGEDQLWFSVPEDAAGQSALLESLIPEAALRF